MSVLTTLVGHLRELLGDDSAREDFRSDPKGHLAKQGFGDVSPSELREAVALVGHDHGGDPGFGDLSAGAGAFAGPPGIGVSDQEADVTNVGLSSANTGHNTAVGNASSNLAASAQAAQAGGGLGGRRGVGDDATAVNTAENTNLSDGTAVIETGNAQAVGNVADTDINQGVSFGSGGGIYIGDQEANVTNVGQANANTGGNTAVGNASTNTATSAQAAAAGAGGLGGGVGDDATAVNTAENTNLSDGTAVIETGNAQAVGNVADTDINQGVSFGSGGGIYIGDQEANVTNVGTANANTGGHTAVGNASTNTAASFQDADAGGGGRLGGGVGDDATALNTADNTNASDGTAVIGTGDASAVGNVADTDINQGTSFGSGGGIYIGDQEANVTNVGQANANTGGNTAVGNASTNTAASFQDADAGGGGPLGGGVGDDATAVNTAANTNVSDGTAAIQTGDASAVGNQADTDINQIVDDAGGDIDI